MGKQKPKYIIYSFSGWVGDLIQLFPIKYMASLLSLLNSYETNSTQVWDRGNLFAMKELCPEGYLKDEIQKVGDNIFLDIKEDKKSSPILSTYFKLLLELAQIKTKISSEKLIRKDAEKILDLGVKIVFLNFWQGPGFKESLYLAKILKQKNKKIKIFGIGHRIAWARQYIADVSPNIDAFILGTNSNSSALKIVKGEDLHQIPNLLFKDKKGKTIDTGTLLDEDLDTKPFPDYSPENYIGIDGKIPIFEINISNEACPYKCNFCVRPTNYGANWKVRDIKRLVDEIEFLNNKYNVQLFRFSDSTPPFGMLTELAQEIINRKLPDKGLKFTGFARIQSGEREDFHTLKKAGWESLFFGIESGSQELLDNVLDKKIRVDEIEATIKSVKDAGISTILSFIVPSPKETEKTQKETFDLINRLKSYTDSVLIQPAGVYPNTEWFRNPEKYGIYLHHNYIKKIRDYPIEPLKPLRLWRPFPFSYSIMGKPAKNVKFSDIVACYERFNKRIRAPKERGGLGIPAIQDYGYIVAKYQNQDPITLSWKLTQFMATRDYNGLRKSLTLIKDILT